MIIIYKRWLKIIELLIKNKEWLETTVKILGTSKRVSEFVGCYNGKIQYWIKKFNINYIQKRRYTKDCSNSKKQLLRKEKIKRWKFLLEYIQNHKYFKVKNVAIEYVHTNYNYKVYIKEMDFNHKSFSSMIKSISRLKGIDKFTSSKPYTFISNENTIDVINNIMNKSNTDIFYKNKLKDLDFKKMSNGQIIQDVVPILNDFVDQCFIYANHITFCCNFDNNVDNHFRELFHESNIKTK